MPEMMPGSKPSKRPQFDNYYDKVKPGASAGQREAAYQRFIRPPKVEDEIRDLLTIRADHGWRKVPGGWVGPNGEYWDGTGAAPWGAAT